jgi:hypothetical protein
MIVQATGGGYAVTQGGNPFLIASAGYTGSAIVGGLIIWLSRTEKGARYALWGLAGLLMFGSVLYLRGDLIGILSGVFWIGFIGLLAAKLSRDYVIFAAQFLGAIQCLAAISAVRDLIWINANTFETRNDAVAVAQMAPFGPMFWAVLWLVFAVVVVLLSLRSAWRSEDPERGVDTWRGGYSTRR